MGFFSQNQFPVQTFLHFTVFVQPPCAITCIYGSHINYRLDTGKYYTTLIGIGSTALAAAVPYPGNCKVT